MKAAFCSSLPGRQDRLLKNYRLKKAFQCEKIPSFSDMYPPPPGCIKLPQLFPQVFCLVNLSNGELQNSFKVISHKMELSCSKHANCKKHKGI